jgi:hypothetical protein
MTAPPPTTVDTSDDDVRRMAPVYIAVIIVEVLVLCGLWAFQTWFS